MAKHIIQEAKRCLACKRPKCVEGCPVNTPIPEMIHLLLEGNMRSAGIELFHNNPLSLVCSLVCPHDRQCEGHCILSKKGQPVHISSIEHYISDYSLETIDLQIPDKKRGTVAIIGSGPAGITLAFILALRGFTITLYESHEKIGGVLRYGIPEFRLPKRILDRLSDKLVHLGVVIRPNTLIGPHITLDELFRDGYDAVFIGTGVWKPNKLNIPGESLGHVHYAIDYLKQPKVYRLGRSVAVIGAGNVAMDVARTALRSGADEVVVVYRKGFEDMPARLDEIEYAKIDGVRFETHLTPINITRDALIVKKRDGELIEMPFESIIIAVSQGPRSNIVSHAKGIAVDERGLVITNDVGQTTRPGVFASGDVVTGARTVVEAVKYSKKVADEIENYILSTKS
jgi:glutamate synthase (NADPH/NADH) small chain